MIVCGPPGTSAARAALEVTETGFALSGCGANCNARLRLKLPHKPKTVACAITEAEGDGAPRATPVAAAWDDQSSTVLLSFRNTAGTTRITGSF